jgi:hypothetical protein
LDWKMGVLEENRIYPLSFARPTSSEALLWRTGDEQLGTRALRFTAFLGDDFRRYRVRF